MGNKSEKQKNPLADINKFFNRRKGAIKIADDYGSMILEAKRKAAEPEPSKEKLNAKNLH